MIDAPAILTARPQLDALVSALDVDMVKLSECLVSLGWCLDLGAAAIPGLHYVLAGTGRMLVKGRQPVELQPHTLVVLPPGMEFRIEATSTTPSTGPLRVLNGNPLDFPDGAVCRYVAGEASAYLIMICGHFRATYGAAIDIFAQLQAPIVRAFSEMVARPGDLHSVDRLADIAGLSRSAFMARFKELLGDSPMSVLRNLRMRQAAALLAKNAMTVDRAAHDVGYASRSSFIRAFRKVYGCDPSNYKAP